LGDTRTIDRRPDSETELDSVVDSVRALAQRPTGTEDRTSTSGKMIYLSYSRRDGDNAAQDVARRLRNEGYYPWIDRENVLPGMSWNDETERALHDSDAIVAVLTPAAVDSPVLEKEWSYVLGLGKPLIPLLIDKSTRMPLVFSDRMYKDSHVDMTDNFEAGLRELSETLRSEIGAPRSS
jgi:TIR domain